MIRSTHSPHVRESGFQTPGKLCLWNLKSWALELQIPLKESGIPLTTRIQNPSSRYKDWNPAPSWVPLYVAIHIIKCLRLKLRCFIVKAASECSIIHFGDTYFISYTHDLLGILKKKILRCVFDLSCCYFPFYDCMIIIIALLFYYYHDYYYIIIERNLYITYYIIERNF